MRKRNKSILVRLSEDEYAQLEKRVAITNFSREEYVRQLIQDREVRAAPPADYYDLIMQVRKVGSNINQLLKLANAKGIILTAELRKALDENHAVEQMLWDTFTVK